MVKFFTKQTPTFVDILKLLIRMGKLPVDSVVYADSIKTMRWFLDLANAGYLRRRYVLFLPLGFYTTKSMQELGQKLQEQSRLSPLLEDKERDRPIERIDITC